MHPSDPISDKASIDNLGDNVGNDIGNVVAKIIAQYKAQPGPLLNVLHAVQNSLGYVPPSSIPLIADGMNLSRAEVHGVVTFYHYFRQTPAGQHTVQICRAEACQAVQGKQLEAHAKQQLGIDYHETTADGRFTLEPVYCLGNCACGPSMTIDGEVFGRVTAQQFDDLVAARGQRS